METTRSRQPRVLTGAILGERGVSSTEARCKGRFGDGSVCGRALSVSQTRSLVLVLDLGPHLSSSAE